MLKSEKIVFIIKGLIVLIGFPINKYPPNTKNYLRCLLIRLIGGGMFSIRGKGLFHTCIASPHIPHQTATVGRSDSLAGRIHHVQNNDSSQ